MVGMEGTTQAPLTGREAGPGSATALQARKFLHGASFIAKGARTWPKADVCTTTVLAPEPKRGPNMKHLLWLLLALLIAPLAAADEPPQEDEPEPQSTDACVDPLCIIPCPPLHLGLTGDLIPPIWWDIAWECMPNPGV